VNKINQDKLVKILAIIFSIEWILLAINPLFRDDWMLENVLVVIYLGLMVWLRKHVKFSNASYIMMFIFLTLHEVGAHYTYAEVPYNEWTTAIFGQSLNDMLGFERNHFDRLIHFVYGLLLFVPLFEVFSQKSRATDVWCYFYAVNMVMSTSMLFELIEWAAAEFFGGDLGIAYLGTQGDVWDAHKDMALAWLGSIIAMLVYIYMPRITLEIDNRV